MHQDIQALHLPNKVLKDINARIIIYYLAYLDTLTRSNFIIDNTVKGNKHIAQNVLLLSTYFLFHHYHYHFAIYDAILRICFSVRVRIHPENSIKNSRKKNEWNIFHYRMHLKNNVKLLFEELFELLII